MKIREILTSEKVVTTSILINTAALFLNGFPDIQTTTQGWLGTIDKLCISFFALEALLKIHSQKKKYFQSGWNRFDFFITLISLPALIPLPIESTTWTSLLRTGRIFRFLRLFKFIPNCEHLALGIQRALKASIGVFAALALLNLILAISATMLFATSSPEHFGNPLKSAYSLLKMFTVEGWYEIPDQVAETHPNSWVGPSLRAYAILSVLIGGILGMGLANAVFIDEMTADNTQKIEKTLAEVQKTLQDIQETLQRQGPPPR